METADLAVNELEHHSIILDSKKPYDCISTMLHPG